MTNETTEQGEWAEFAKQSSWAEFAESVEAEFGAEFAESVEDDMRNGLWKKNGPKTAL